MSESIVKCAVCKKHKDGEETDFCEQCHQYMCFDCQMITDIINCCDVKRRQEKPIDAVNQSGYSNILTRRN